MMYAVTDNGSRIEASKGQMAFCELCHESVISKCGKIKIHHWSHRSGTECDVWHESETPWHVNWKKQFGEASREFVMNRIEGKHRADIYSTKWACGRPYVIEFQHSFLEIGQIREREAFYGPMCWVIDASGFMGNIMVKEVYKRDDEHIVYFQWKRVRKSWCGAAKDLYLDTGDEMWRVRRMDDSGDCAADVISYHQFVSEYSDSTGENFGIKWSTTKSGNLIYRFGFGHVLIYKRQDSGYGLSVLRLLIDRGMNHRDGVYPTIDDAKQKCEGHIGKLMRQGRTRAESELSLRLAEGM